MPASALLSGAMEIQVTAEDNRTRLRDAAVLAVHLTGPAGEGKTSLIEAALARLAEPGRVAVVMADHDAWHQTQRLIDRAGWIVPVDAERLTSEALAKALDQIDLRRCDLVLIESPGDDEEPMDIGESVRLAVVSTTSGQETLGEQAAQIAEAPVVLLSKLDLLPGGEDRQQLFREVRRLSPNARVFELSSATGQGMEQWILWLEMRGFEIRFRRSRCDPEQIPAEWWFG